MRIDVPLFKIMARPLLPVSGSWVDASPFVIFFGILVVAHLLLKRGKNVQFWRRVCQFTSAFVFIIFLHRCLCMLRSWIFALNKVGRNDVIAFGHLCMFALLVSLTLAFGRLFCSWLCPLGLFSEFLSWVGRARRRLPRARRLLAGYLMLGGTLTLVTWFAYMTRPGTQFFAENIAAFWGAFLLLYLAVVLPFEFSDRRFKGARYVSAVLWMLLSVVGVFVTSPWCTFFGDEIDYSSAVSLAAVLSGALVVPMAWCRYLCPMGGALGWIAKFAPRKLANHTACTGCGACISVCPMGALDHGEIDHSSCIVCGSCLETCGFHFQITEASADSAEPVRDDKEGAADA